MIDTCDIVDKLYSALLAVDSDILRLDVVESRLYKDAQEHCISLFSCQGLI